MSEIRVIDGRHWCGREMDVRIIEVKEKEVFAWMIYGVCKKCEIVLVQELFVQKEQPKQDFDFLIDWKKKADKPPSEGFINEAQV